MNMSRIHGTQTGGKAYGISLVPIPIALIAQNVEVPERLLLSAIMNTQDIMSRHSKFYA